MESAAPAMAPDVSSGGQESTSDGGFDAKQAITEARRARQETSGLKSAFDKRFESVDQDLATVKKMREVFQPQEKAAPDPIGHLNSQLDYYLEQAVEAKSRNQAIPLTTNLAVQFFQSQIENLQVINALKDEIKALRGGVSQANDPQKPVNDAAYSHMENFMQNAIDSLYGTDDLQRPIKKQVYQAATQMVVANLKELQAKAPQEWDRIRRNQGDLQKIVNNAIRQIIPPKARSLIEQDHLMNTPMEEGELWAAFREANQIKDPKERQSTRERIRQDILMEQARKRGKRR